MSSLITAWLNNCQRIYQNELVWKISVNFTSFFNQSNISSIFRRFPSSRHPPKTPTSILLSTKLVKCSFLHLSVRLQLCVVIRNNLSKKQMINCTVSDCCCCKLLMIGDCWRQGWESCCQLILKHGGLAGLLLEWLLLLLLISWLWRKSLNNLRKFLLLAEQIWKIIFFRLELWVNKPYWLIE